MDQRCGVPSGRDVPPPNIARCSAKNMRTSPSAAAPSSRWHKSRRRRTGRNLTGARIAAAGSRRRLCGRASKSCRRRTPPRSDSPSVAALRRPGRRKARAAAPRTGRRLLARTAKRGFRFRLRTDRPSPQPEVLKRADLWLKTSYADEFARATGLFRPDDLGTSRQAAGQRQLGRRRFGSRAATVPVGNMCPVPRRLASALGPELSGAARRFSRETLHRHRRAESRRFTRGTRRQ